MSDRASELASPRVPHAAPGARDAWLRAHRRILAGGDGMRRMFVIAVVVLGAIAPGVQADAPVALGENAALRYWRAFGLMAPWPALNDAIEEADAHLTEQAFNVSFDAGAMLRSADDVLENLERAASLEHCDFGIDGGLGGLVPHIGFMRQASNLVLANARLAAQDGDPATAARMVALAIRMADHTAQNGVMVSCMSAISQFEDALGVTRRIMQSRPLPPAQRTLVLDALRGLSAADPMHVRRCLILESDMMIEWLDAALRSADGRLEIVDMLESAVAYPSGEPPDGTDATIRAVRFGDADTLVKEMRRAYDALFEAWDADDREAALTRWRERVDAEEYGVFVAGMIPAVERLNDRAATAQRNLAAFKEILAE